MKNFWLERKQNRGIRFLTSSGHTLELIDTPEETFPHIYGFKSPSKHTIGYINEDEPACEKRWKRLEIMSSMGTYFIMRDDELPCGDWTNTKEKNGRTEE